MCRGSQAIVHHWYQPDSYDSLLPAAQAPELVEPDKRPAGVFPAVMCRAADPLLVACRSLARDQALAHGQQPVQRVDE